MTFGEAKHTVMTCHWRDDSPNHRKDMRDVICRGTGLPCLRVLEKGRCDMLLELARKEQNNECRQ